MVLAVPVQVRAPQLPSEVLRDYGLRAAGGNYRELSAAIERWGISTEHFTYRRRRRASSGSVGVPLVEVLVEHSAYHRGSLKRRLYREGFKQRRCEICGLGEEWNGAPISLILDHVNGVHDDRLENLRIVCPNCNATLPTHCGRSLEPRHPPYEQLLAEIAATSWSAVGRKYGVSGNAIRKWVRVEERARAAAEAEAVRTETPSSDTSHAPPREEAA